MKGRTKTARESAERLDPGTYQMTLDRAYVEIGMPKPEYCKKDPKTGAVKTPEESAYAQMCLIWRDTESGAEQRDKFLKMPEHIEFDDSATYKSKFQKRLEGMLNKQLGKEDGNHLEVKFEFIEEWDELMDAIRETEQGRPATVDVKGLLWQGHEMFGRDWLVTIVGKEGSEYTNVSAVAPLPKRRAPAPQQAQPAPATAQPPQQKAAPAAQPPARPAAHAGDDPFPAGDEEGMPF